jgi:two-component system, NarL family, sensor histidine kinase BarA
MQKNAFKTSLRQKLIWLGVAPGILLSIGLFILNHFFEQGHQQAHHKAQLLVIEEMLRQFDQQKTTEQHRIDFTPLSAALLSHPHLLSVALLTPDGRIDREAGLPISTAQLASLAQNSEITADDRHLKRFSTGSATWVLSFDNKPLSIIHYKFSLWNIVLFSIFIAIILFLHQRLYKKLQWPIQQFNQQIKALQNKTEALMPSDINFGPLSEAAAGVNDLLRERTRNQDDIRQSFETVFSDLRESYDTVEIRNIELDMARKNALQASRVKSEFLANTGHDLLTPLHSSLNAIQQLARSPLNDQQQDYIHNLESTTQGVISLINDIIDFSKLETGKLHLEVKPIQIRRMLQDILSLHAPLANEKNTRLLHLVYDNVPEPLLGDPLRIQQVFTNLLSNAIAQSRGGNISIKISAAAPADKKITVKFAITDSSGGLDDSTTQALMQQLAEPIAGDAPHQGLSLGLSIAKGLVDKMHGNLGISYSADTGTLYWFTAKVELLEKASHPAKSTGALDGYRILVIDEQSSSREELVHHLKFMGATCLEVPSFAQLDTQRDQWRNFNPQLAVMDSLNAQHQFQMANLVAHVAWLNTHLELSVLLVTHGSNGKPLKKELDPVNASLINRPLLSTKLQQSVISQASMTALLKANRTQPYVVAPTADTSSEHTHRILVVDDNAANTKLVAEFLRNSPIKVETLNSGELAIARCESEKFDLIFMDIQMPGLNGFETTKQLRQNETGKARTPIVALTAQDVNEQRAKFIVAGMDDYLSKPINYDELMTLINKWLGDSFLATPSDPFFIFDTEIAASGAEERKPVVVIQECLRLAKNSPALAKDMLQMLIEGLDRDEQQLNELSKKHDWPGLQAFAHKLYGACCYSGVPGLKEASQTLDRMLQEGNWQTLGGRIERLKTEIQRLKQWSESYDLDALFDTAT